MIGIFDSGIGGLTVVSAVMKALPDHDIVYFGDTARTPYGTKSPRTIRKYALEDANFLKKNGARMIIMACNTASSIAFDAVRSTFDMPVFEVVTPAAEMAVKASKKGMIGVIGTRATITSGIYEKKIKEINVEARVWSASCPLLVPLVEEGWMKKPETAMIVKKYLLPLKTRQIDTLILGCTHYPVLKKTIQRKIGKRARIIDSSEAVAMNIKTFLSRHPELSEKMSRTGKHRFFVSDLTPQFRKTAVMILKQNISLEASTP